MMLDTDVEGVDATKITNFFTSVQEPGSNQ